MVALRPRYKGFAMFTMKTISSRVSLSRLTVTLNDCEGEISDPASPFSTGWPITGTTLPVFPLDSVRTRFQIMGKIPGYRNHFFRERRIAYSRPSCSCGRRDGRRYAESKPTNHRRHHDRIPADPFWRQQECIHDHRLPDRSGQVMRVPLSTRRTTGKSQGRKCGMRQTCHPEALQRAVTRGCSSDGH